MIGTPRLAKSEHHSNKPWDNSKSTITAEQVLDNGNFGGPNFGQGVSLSGFAELAGDMDSNKWRALLHHHAPRRCEAQQPE